MEEELPIRLVLVDDDAGIAALIESIIKYQLSEIDIIIIWFKSKLEVSEKALNLLIAPDAIIWDGQVIDGTTTDKFKDNKSLIELASDKFPDCLMIAFSSVPDIRQQQIVDGCMVSIDKPMNTQFFIETIRGLAESRSSGLKNKQKIREVA